MKNLFNKTTAKDALKLGVLGLYGAAIGAASLAMTLAVDVKPAPEKQDPQVSEQAVEHHDAVTPAP